MARAKKKAKAKPRTKATRKAARKVRKAAGKKRKTAAGKPAIKKRKSAAKKKPAARKAGGSKARTLIVLFNLRRGVGPAAYEKWARTTDIPIAGGLKSVKDFKVYRAEGIFGSKARPPYKYFEILHVTGIDGLVKDIGKEPRMADVAAAFQKFADPVFIVTEKIAG